MEDFDHIANDYDADFTHSLIGRAQRDIVHELILHYVSDLSNKQILELNCGTGEDANWLLQNGANVIATDISPEMIEVTRKKIPSVETKVLDVRDLGESFVDDQFDLIFSNFGGLNCINESDLTAVLKAVQSKLKVGGKAIFVIMPNACRWESFYFSAKGQFSKAKRRKSKHAVQANVDGVLVDTWYYSPDKIAEITKMKLLGTHPVGYYIPPSYLEPWIQRHPKIWNSLKKKEQRIRNKANLARKSDHYLICLTK